MPAGRATPEDGKALRIREATQVVTGWSSEIDSMNADLQPLNSFVLPGGTPAAAFLHLGTDRHAAQPSDLSVSSPKRETDQCLRPFAISIVYRIICLFSRDGST